MGGGDVGAGLPTLLLRFSPPLASSRGASSLHFCHQSVGGWYTQPSKHRAYRRIGIIDPLSPSLSSKEKETERRLYLVLPTL